MSHPLDHPVRAALTGPHAGLAESRGAAVAYRPQIAALAAVDPAAGPAAWTDLARLRRGTPLTVVFLPAEAAAAPRPGFVVTREFTGLQMTGDDVHGRPDAEAVELDRSDLAEMQDLVRRTDPGPFGPGALQMGRFLGIRRGGRLVAMAGERLQLPEHVEISAVCTDPAARGEGLAARLVGAVAAGARERGRTPLLHVATHNTGAMRVYERLGFRVRREMWFAGLRSTVDDTTPAGVGA